MNVTHVAEFRFYDLDEDKAAIVDRVINKALFEHGMMFRKEYDMVFHPVGAAITWESKQEDGDKPSSKQLGFARKLWVDLKNKIVTETNIDLAAKAQDLLGQVQTVMKDPEVTKKQASEAIGVQKEALDELNFSQNGVTTSGWQ
jgi:hypothetical protein